jgi:uncharacterized protein (DUF1501 family)
MKQNWKTCGGHASLTRRHFLFGAASAALLGVRADAETVTSPTAVKTRNSARACIFINLNGGASHLDTFDPKDGPWNAGDMDLAQHPGGLVLSRKLFPKLSTMTQDVLALRSCSSWEAAHERAQFYIQTAHSQNPALAAEIPHVGAVVAYEKGAKGLLPPFLSFNQSNLQGATFLGGPNMPMMPPATRAGLTTLSHNFFGASSRQRFEDRFRLLQDLDEPLRQNPYNDVMAAYAGYYARAKSMMYEDSVDAVFKFSVDDENRYGANSTGRALLVARNAVRAKNGAVFINVTQGGWDLHVGQFDRSLGTNLYTLANDLDRGVGSLVEDLKASGDLNETLIVMMGEFGRTPGVLNSRSGRDHYRPVMSVAMIGGGVRGGRVIGASDASGALITDTGWSADRAIYPDDIAATIYSALGIDWTKTIDDTPSGRRFYYVNGAGEGGFRPVEEVFA